MVPPLILAMHEVTESETQRLPEDEFVAWAMANEVRAEWVNGEVVLMSPAALKHIRISGWIYHVLGLYIQAKQLGELLGPDFMVRLHHAVVSRRVPDLLFVSHNRLCNLQPNHLEGPPDLAVEVVSPDSVDRDWRDKYSEYEASGVLEYWIVDPLTETFQASVRNAEGCFVKSEPDESGVWKSTVVPGFWLKPDWFWQSELPDPFQTLRSLGVLN